MSEWIDSYPLAPIGVYRGKKAESLILDALARVFNEHPSETFDVKAISGWVRAVYEREEPDSLNAERFSAVVRIPQGKYRTICGWCDTTGWSCQSGFQSQVFDSDKEAIMLGLSNEDRDALGLPGPDPDLPG